MICTKESRSGELQILKCYMVSRLCNYNWIG